MCVTQDQFIRTSLFVVFTGGFDREREREEEEQKQWEERKRRWEEDPKKQFLDQHLIDLLNSL